MRWALVELLDMGKTTSQAFGMDLLIDRRLMSM